MGNKKEYDDYTPGAVYNEARDNGLLGVVLKWGCAIFVLLLLMSVCGSFTGFWGKWWDAGVQVVSPENVREQFRAAYDDMNALRAVAQNICTLEKARDAETNPDLKSQRTSQILAQEQNYQRIQNHYNAYVSDPFRAKYVRPSDLPRTAPTEAEEKAAVC